MMNDALLIFCLLINNCYDNLGNNNFADRENAERVLFLTYPFSWDVLRKGETNDDPEVRVRSLRAIERIINEKLAIK